jgi:hypothetical protein
MRKIILKQIPAAAEQALREHISSLEGFDIMPAGESISDISAQDPDLVITGVPVSVPGCPVLQLSFARPQAFGTLLRQIGQMLAQPVLYIDDIAAITFSGRRRRRWCGKGQPRKVKILR